MFLEGLAAKVSTGEDEDTGACELKTEVRGGGDCLGMGELKTPIKGSG